MKLSIHQEFEKSWRESLAQHDLFVNTAKKDPRFPLLEKHLKNKRKRILWNITRAINLHKQAQQNG